MPKPRCIIVTGRPGAGKTTLAAQLAQQLRLPLLSRDGIKEGYVHTIGLPHHQLPPTTNGLITNFFFETVSHYLHNQISVVIEAAFQHQLWEPRMPRLLELSRPYLLICMLDAQIAAQRHLERGLADPSREFFHGDDHVAIYRETGELPPLGPYHVPDFELPTLHIDTAHGYAPGLPEIVQFINDH